MAQHSNPTPFPSEKQNDKVVSQTRHHKGDEDKEPQGHSKEGQRRKLVGRWRGQGRGRDRQQQEEQNNRNKPLSKSLPPKTTPANPQNAKRGESIKFESSIELASDIGQTPEKKGRGRNGPTYNKKTAKLEQKDNDSVPKRCTEVQRTTKPDERAPAVGNLKSQGVEDEIVKPQHSKPKMLARHRSLNALSGTQSSLNKNASHFFNASTTDVVPVTSSRTSTRNRSRKKTTQTPQSSQTPGTRIIHSNFYTDMHMVCRAALYKVHAPKCSCQPIIDLRKKFNIKLIDKSMALNDVEKELSSKSGTDAKQLHFVSLTDSLLVIPKHKNIQVAYACEDTPLNVFRSQSMELESKLMREIETSLPSTVPETCPEVKLEIQGAACLLAKNPNAFACIASNNFQSLQKVQSWGHAGKSENLSAGKILETDHADFLGILRRRVLWNLLSSKKIGLEQQREATHAIVHALSKQGIDLNRNEEVDRNHEELPTLKIGHHLRTVLLETQGSMRNIAETAKENVTEKVGSFWLVMISKQGQNWELDLPGGKRHIGESTWEGLVRETLEETSLRLDKSWLSETRPTIKNPSELSNIYYILWPALLPYD